MKGVFEKEKKSWMKGGDGPKKFLLRCQSIMN